MNRPALLSALAAVAVLVSSCTAEIAEPVTADTADSHVQPTPGSTPQAFVNRAELESCGEFTLELGEEVPASAIDCLNGAIGAGGAELVVTSQGMEGGRVVGWFRALPGSGVEKWEDVREDSYAGEGSWLHSVCPSVDSWPPDPDECTDESFD